MYLDDGMVVFCNLVWVIKINMNVGVGGGRETSYRFRRRSTSDAYEKGSEDVGARIVPPYNDV